MVKLGADGEPVVKTENGKTVVRKSAGKYLDAMDAEIENPTELRTDDAFKAEFGEDVHPETYVLYVTRKLKYYTSETP